MTIENILVAIDFSPCSDEAAAQAAELACAVGAQLHLLHVYRLPGLPEGAPLSSHSLEDAEAVGRRGLEQLAARYGASCRLGDRLVCLGDPAETIVSSAERVAADLIVLGMHGRHGLSRLFLGSVAQAVARTAACSVLIARKRPA